MIIEFNCEYISMRRLREDRRLERGKRGIHSPARTRDIAAQGIFRFPMGGAGLRLTGMDSPASHFNVNNKLSSLTIFFPAYHDEHTIEPLTRTAVELARTISDDFEIIIVNDNSPDRVGEIADNLSREFREVRAIHHERNLGVSHAMTTGYKAATKDWVFYTDGDAQYDLAELPLLVEHADKYEIIAGYRLNRAEGIVRALASRGFHMLVLLFFGYYFKDIDCSFKLIHQNFLKKITFYTGGGLLDTEIMVQARKLKVPVKYVGVHHYQRRFGTSQFLRFKLVRSMFLDLVKLRFKLL